MAMNLGAKGGPAAEINMTPLIDVLLVLLIIFMVITPLAPEGLPARVPQPSPDAAPPSDDRTVVVSIDKDQHLQINQSPVTFEDLGPRLREIFKTRAEQVCFVRGDSDLEYRVVARVIDTVKGAGLEQIGLIAKDSLRAN